MDDLDHEIFDIENGVLKGIKKELSGFIEIPEGVITIESNAIEDQLITGVRFPNSLRRILNYAFSGCVFLPEVDISNDVFVGKKAFPGIVKVNRHRPSICFKRAHVRDSKEPPVTSKFLKEKIKQEYFGVEVEVIMTQAAVAKAIISAIDGEISDNTDKMKNNRMYSVMSKKGQIWGVDDEPTLGRPLHCSSELVTPRLHYSQMPELEAVLKAMTKEGGGWSSESSAIHVHVDSIENGTLEFENPTNRLMANFFLMQEELYDYLEMRPDLLEYAEKNKGYVVAGMIDAESSFERRQKWNELGKLFESEKAVRHQAINLNNFRSCEKKNTIEFRLFNAPLKIDVKKTKAYIDLSLAIKVASEVGVRIPPIIEEGKSRRESFNALLEAIGLSGTEYAATRKILTAGASYELVSKDQAREYMREYEVLSHGRPIVKGSKLSKII